MTVDQANLIIKKHTAKLFDKWKKTEIIDGIKSDIDRLAVIVESQPKQIYVVNDMTPEDQEFSEAMFVIADSWKVDRAC